jgi:hypothetical protein
VAPPAAPAVSEQARHATYLIAREGAAATLAREEPDGRRSELARSQRRLLGPRWEQLAALLLADACGAPPPAKLARDLGRFIVVASGERRLRGEELVSWLGGWRPGVTALLLDRR